MPLGKPVALHRLTSNGRPAFPETSSKKPSKNHSGTHRTHRRHDHSPASPISTAHSPNHAVYHAETREPIHRGSGHAEKHQVLHTNRFHGPSHSYKEHESQHTQPGSSHRGYDQKGAQVYSEALSTHGQASDPEGYLQGWYDGIEDGLRVYNKVQEIRQRNRKTLPRMDNLLKNWEDVQSFFRDRDDPHDAQFLFYAFVKQHRAGLYAAEAYRARLVDCTACEDTIETRLCASCTKLRRGYANDAQKAANDARYYAQRLGIPWEPYKTDLERGSGAEDDIVRIKDSYGKTVLEGYPLREWREARPRRRR